MTALELDEFLADDSGDAYDWVIPGLLERGDRVILTGAEGHGKMTLMRQMGVQAASGIHPFTLNPIDPVRVLILDLQESERQLRRALRPLRITAGRRYVQGNLHVQSQAEGLDIRATLDQKLLLDLIMDTRPDLLVAGPVYKLSNADPIEETEQKRIATILDHIRVTFNVAMILEAHMPYATSGRGRVERPYGWSGWSRWPEFGICLTDSDTLSHWRGARDERDWPTGLKRGGEWPFTPLVTKREITWARIQDYCLEAGDQPTQRDLAGLCGVSVGLINKIIKEHQAEWDSFAAVGDE